ncbi:hypothetical protein TNCT_513581 [Trichonephila clavata]|uniref:Uncharacterized protein n=1 Tax=Trichonephila clavata TaxID=2740835 RepID=A0A8X6LYW8_TRICU|nr:hypothetical protein TNCT_513581 [Trichonephila clavata]
MYTVVQCKSPRAAWGERPWKDKALSQMGNQFRHQNVGVSIGARINPYFLRASEIIIVGEGGNFEYIHPLVLGLGNFLVNS